MSGGDDRAVDVQQAVRIGAADYRHRVLITCGDGVMAHKLAARGQGGSRKKFPSAATGRKILGRLAAVDGPGQGPEQAR